MTDEMIFQVTVLIGTAVVLGAVFGIVFLLTAQPRLALMTGCLVGSAYSWAGDYLSR